MPILRAFLALLAGFAAMAALVGVATAALAKFAPGFVGRPGQPRTGYVFVNLGYSLSAAILGGYITTWVARDHALIHIAALALIVLLLGALSALQQRGRQPIWYQLLLVAIMPVGTLLGGLLRLRVTGSL
jgi:hypothetical protein